MPGMRSGLAASRDLSEKQIENECINWLRHQKNFRVVEFKIKSVGTYDAKLNRFRSSSPLYRKGCPDIVCSIQGRFVGFEIKTRTGRLSEHQKQAHEAIRASGGEVYVIRSVQQLEEVFHSRLNTCR